MLPIRVVKAKRFKELVLQHHLEPDYVLTLRATATKYMEGHSQKKKEELKVRLASGQASVRSNKRLLDLKGHCVVQEKKIKLSILTFTILMR